MVNLGSPDLKVESVTYNDLLDGNLPEANLEESGCDRLRIKLFYPNRFRDAHFARLLQSDRLYGGPRFGDTINSFFDLTQSILVSYYGNSINFVNSVSGIKDSGDKREIFNRLKNCVPTPNRFCPTQLEDLLDIVSNGISLFVKVRFGGCGRAMSYLSPEGWYTNFLWDGQAIRNRSLEGDTKWPFVEIPQSQRKDFSRELMKYDSHFVFEQDLKPLL